MKYVDVLRCLAEAPATPRAIADKLGERVTTVRVSLCALAKAERVLAMPEEPGRHYPRTYVITDLGEAYLREATRVHWPARTALERAWM